MGRMLNLLLIAEGLHDFVQLFVRDEPGDGASTYRRRPLGPTRAAAGDRSSWLLANCRRSRAIETVLRLRRATIEGKRRRGKFQLKLTSTLDGSLEKAQQTENPPMRNLGCRWRHGSKSRPAGRPYLADYTVGMPCSVGLSPRYCTVRTNTRAATTLDFQSRCASNSVFAGATHCRPFGPAQGRPAFDLFSLTSSP